MTSKQIYRSLHLTKSQYAAIADRIGASWNIVGRNKTKTPTADQAIAVRKYLWDNLSCETYVPLIQRIIDDNEKNNR